MPPVTSDVNGVDVPTGANPGADYATSIIAAVGQLTEPVATLPASPSTGEIACLEVASGKYWHLLYNGTLWCPIGAQFPFRGQDVSPSGVGASGETGDLITVPVDGVYDIESTVRAGVAGGLNATFTNRKRSGSSTDVGESIACGPGWAGFVVVKALGVTLTAGQTIRFGWTLGGGPTLTLDHLHTTMWPVSVDA